MTRQIRGVGRDEGEEGKKGKQEGKGEGMSKVRKSDLSKRMFRSGQPRQVFPSHASVVAHTTISPLALPPPSPV